MDISAIAAAAQSSVSPVAGMPTREALAQEFGRMLFQTMLQGAGSASQKSHKANAAGSGMSMDFVTGQFAQQLAAQHQQLFAALLFGGNNQGERP